MAIFSKTKTIMAPPKQTPNKGRRPFVSTQWSINLLWLIRRKNAAIAFDARCKCKSSIVGDRYCPAASRNKGAHRRWTALASLGGIHRKAIHLNQLLIGGGLLLEDQHTHTWWRRKLKLAAGVTRCHRQFVTRCVYVRASTKKAKSSAPLYFAQVSRSATQQLVSRKVTEVVHYYAPQRACGRKLRAARSCPPAMLSGGVGVQACRWGEVCFQFFFPPSSSSPAAHLPPISFRCFFAVGSLPVGGFCSEVGGAAAGAARPLSRFCVFWVNQFRCRMWGGCHKDGEAPNNLVEFKQTKST